MSEAREGWAAERGLKPVTFAHYCPEWDFLLIHPGDPEFEACICLTRISALTLPRPIDLESV